MPKAIVHLYSFQHQCERIAQTLKDIHTAIAHMQELKIRYKGASIYLHKKMKPHTELEKAWIHMQIRNYGQIPSLITSIEASYERLFKSLDVIVQMHKICSIGTLT